MAPSSLERAEGESWGQERAWGETSNPHRHLVEQTGAAPRPSEPRVCVCGGGRGKVWAQAQATCQGRFPGGGGIWLSPEKALLAPGRAWVGRP